MYSVYLYLHQMMAKLVTNQNRIITKKQAHYVIGKYIRWFTPYIKKDLLREMVGMQLLEWVNRDKLRIIHLEKSQHISSGLLLTIMESVEKTSLVADEIRVSENESYVLVRSTVDGRILFGVNEEHCILSQRKAEQVAQAIRERIK